MRQAHSALWRTLVLTLALLGLGYASTAAAPSPTVETRHTPSTGHFVASLLPTQTTRPNIILLLTDDLDALLGTTDRMPNLRALVQARNELALWLAKLRGCAADTCRQVEDAAPRVANLYLPTLGRAGER